MMEISRSADVRVYLFTYRRNNLLPRAVQGLLQQTHLNWVCELHNDDPNDSFPEQLIAQIDDPRIKYVHHEKNLGAVSSFNLAFRQVSEPFISILEDDNWWEPNFLERMVREMDHHPDVQLAWSNMRYWRENMDGSWTPENTIWPIDEGNSTEFFQDLVPAQLMQNIHSQGAMLVRMEGQNMRPCPINVPLFMIEAARERNIPGPLMLIRDPLANFAVTLSNARNEDAAEKLGGLALLVSEFIRSTCVPIQFYRQACRHEWWAGRMSLRAIVLGAMFVRRFDIVLASKRPLEVVLAFVWFFRHPCITLAALKFMLNEGELRSYLVVKSNPAIS